MSNSNSRNERSMLSLFASHRVAANLLMLLMLIAGIWGLKRLNTQFFPTFELDVITISVPWSGATAEDIEQSILLPVEEELKSVSDIDSLLSTATLGQASVRLELKEGSDFDFNLDLVKQKIDGIRRNLPADSEEPVVQKVVRYENIAGVLLTGRNASLDELRPLARSYERELLQLGVSKIDFIGMPDQEIALKIRPEMLDTLNISMSELATQVRQQSLDLPAGTAAKTDGSRQIRSLNQQRDAEGFRQLPLFTDRQGRLVRLGDIAQVEQRTKDRQILLAYQGQPAVVLQLLRPEGEDTLKSAQLLNSWLDERRPTLPPGVQLLTFDETWQPVKDRINLLLKNGLSGLVLVILILFLFLNARVAFWVTVGIPISFMATLAVLYGIGGSINMISLFGLIMALGIIVDDAIVVGEDTLTHVQMGEPGLQAAIGGAHRMFAPVMASSMTTIAAFLPLLMIGGIIGNILVDIPTVVICVIVASLVECFLILPGHLHHSLKHRDALSSSKVRSFLDRQFNRFRDTTFRRMMEFAINFRWLTIATALGIFVLSIGLLAGGRIKFNFFPAVERDQLTVNIQFSAGTDAERVSRFLNHLDDTLYLTEEELGGNLVKVAYQKLRQADFSRTSSATFTGDEFGALKVELISGDTRSVSNATLIKAWRKRIIMPPGLEKFSIDVATSGPPGKPIQVKLAGQDIQDLKGASAEVQALLKTYSGLSNISDDLPYGKSQLIYHLTPEGKAAGLTLESVGRQLRAAFEGLEVQSFYQNNEEIEVRVVLPDDYRDHFYGLQQLPILLPSGTSTPLENVVRFDAQKGLDVLTRVDNEVALNVTADLDETAANANEIIASLQSEGRLDKITQTYGVKASFEGKNKDQRETMADMKTGLMLALALIFIILSWVFASYWWPIAVMLAIPLGLTGAVLGHWALGIDLTILSLFGFFGLSGIVINDSIVLVTFYKKLREAGKNVHDAVVEAGCQRLRAVLLTSLTTIAGLTPIIFETSLQAQFLIPMAVSIVFGLAYGTLLILFFVPAMLTIIEHRSRRAEAKAMADQPATVQQP